MFTISQTGQLRHELRNTGSGFSHIGDINVSRLGFVYRIYLFQLVLITCKVQRGGTANISYTVIIYVSNFATNDSTTAFHMGTDFT